MRHKKYDIFISYRRSCSYDTANLIATKLKMAGYSVFFDLESLRSNKFNTQLYHAIDNCTDFLAVLPPNALDRCVNEDDWVRLEVCRALKGDKNIIPIMLNGFSWPNPMPDGMEELRNYQAITASSVEHFDLAMERLQNRYLKSKKRKSLLRYVKFSGVILASVIAILALLWGVFSFLSKDVCVKYATQLTSQASFVSVIAEENYKFRQNWNVFVYMLNDETSPELLEMAQDDFIEQINLTEQNLKQAQTLLSTAKVEIPLYHQVLLSMYGINSEDLSIGSQFAMLYYNDYLSFLENVRMAVTEPNNIKYRRFVSALFEAFDHEVNVYYAGLLSILSYFPESSLTAYKQLSPQWIYFPIQRYVLGETEDYYAQIINTETILAEKAMSEGLIELDDAVSDELDMKFQLKKQAYKHILFNVNTKEGLNYGG